MYLNLQTVYGAIRTREKCQDLVLNYMRLKTNCSTYCTTILISNVTPVTTVGCPHVASAT